MMLKFGQTMEDRLQVAQTGRRLVTTLIREFEERVNRDFLAGKLVRAIHLYSGEESLAVGVCAQFRR